MRDINQIAYELSRCVRKECNICPYHNNENCKDLLIAEMCVDIRLYVKTHPDEDDLK